MTARRLGLVATILFCAFRTEGRQVPRAQAGQQQRDTRPRVFVETGPPSDLTSESDLQAERNTFSESFPNFCPGAVITEDRRKASYVIRLSERATYEPAILYNMAVFRKDGDQIFTDAASQRPDTSHEGIKNPLMRLMRGACAVIVYGMDSGTVYWIIRQAERREPRIHIKATAESAADTDEKALRGLATLFGIAFSQACFCVERTDDFGRADYILQVDMSKKGDNLTILDRSGHVALDEQQLQGLDAAKIFSRTVPLSQANSSSNSRVTANELLRGACEAILRREQP